MFDSIHAKLRIAFIAVSIVGCIISLVISEPYSVYVLLATCGLGFLWSLPSAVKGLSHRTCNTSLLLCVSILGAIGLWYFGTDHVLLDASFIVMLHEVAEIIEDLGRARTTDALTSLLNTMPKVAHVVVGNHSLNEGDIDVNELNVGDKIRVRAGEIVPVDCVLLSESGSVNETGLTGESKDVEKHAGDTVYGGSVNVNKLLLCRVEHTLADSYVTDIVKAVKDSMDCTTSVGNFIDSFVAYMMPCLLGLAFVVGVAIPVASMVFGIDTTWSVWGYRGLCVLVSGCPCALLLSAPVAYVSGMSCAAHRGIVVRGGEAFSVGAKINHVVFDKTGTITYGKPCISEIRCFNGFDESTVLGMAASMEVGSTHPLGRVICDEANLRGIKLQEAFDVSERPGQGLVGVVGLNVVHVGSLDLIESIIGFSRPLQDLVTNDTAVYVSIGTKMAGLITFTDSIRESASDAIDMLRCVNRDMQTSLLSGDSVAVTESVVATLGIENHMSKCLPQDKVRFIVMAQNLGDTVAIVGDGLNDAPAMTAANLGIAFGERASDVTSTVADVVIPGSDLRSVVDFLCLSQRVRHILIVSLLVTIVVKVLTLLLALHGDISMTFAMAFDIALSLFVVFNGLRARVWPRRWSH